MSQNGLRELSTLVDSLRGLRCWHVSRGGCTLPTFQLALGEKVARPRALRNPAQPEEFRRYEGEANLLVWCSWRLDGPDRLLTSSDDTAEAIVRELGKVVGATADSMTLLAPAWDLVAGFSNGLRLRIFCDHLPGEPSFDGNWELWRRDVVALVGPGTHYDIRPRGEREAAERAAAQPSGPSA